VSDFLNGRISMGKTLADPALLNISFSVFLAVVVSLV
jgi:hypothetical protein